MQQTIQKSAIGEEVLFKEGNFLLQPLIVSWALTIYCQLHFSDILAGKYSM